jgi:hypothetical protein
VSYFDLGYEEIVMSQSNIRQITNGDTLQDDNKMTSNIPALDLHSEAIARREGVEYEDEEWKEF